MTGSIDRSKVAQKLRDSGFKRKRAAGMAEVLAGVVTEVQADAVLEAVRLLQLEHRADIGRLEALLQKVLDNQVTLLNDNLAMKRRLGDA